MKQNALKRQGEDPMPPEVCARTHNDAETDTVPKKAVIGTIGLALATPMNLDWLNTSIAGSIPSHMV